MGVAGACQLRARSKPTRMHVTPCMCLTGVANAVRYAGMLGLRQVCRQAG